MFEVAALENHPFLSDSQSQEAGRELQSMLVELVDLSLLGKELHWCVVGPHFRPLHLMLDELVDEWRELADTVAERAVAIGIWPDGQARAIVAQSKLEPMNAGPINGELVVEALAGRLEAIVIASRRRMEQLEHDLPSQDILIEILRALEKQLWMVRAQAV